MSMFLYQVNASGLAHAEALHGTAWHFHLTCEIGTFGMGVLSS